jgi:hypothetical protein
MSMGEIYKVFTEKIYLRPIYKTILFILLLCILIGFLYICVLSKTQTIRVDTTRFFLSVIRRDVNDYKEKIGKYPPSLKDAVEYNKKNKLFPVLNEFYFDFNSESHANIPEYNELNNKGGYYYNKETGEARLNLTKPVKKYFMFYFGTRSNEIPAEW